MRPGSHRRRPSASSGPRQSRSIRIDLPQCAWPAPVKGIWGFLIWLQGVAGNLGAWVSPGDRPLRVCPGHVSLGSKLPVSGATPSFPALSLAFDVTVSNFGPSDGCTVKLHYGFNLHPWPGAGHLPTADLRTYTLPDEVSRSAHVKIGLFEFFMLSPGCPVEVASRPTGLSSPWLSTAKPIRRPPSKYPWAELPNGLLTSRHRYQTRENSVCGPTSRQPSLRPRAGRPPLPRGQEDSCASCSTGFHPGGQPHVWAPSGRERYHV